MKKRLIMVFILFFILLMIIGLVAGVKYKFFKNDFRYAGTLEATKVDLSARLPAVIDHMNIREGDHVKTKQTLLTLSCEDFRIADKLANDNYERTLKLYKGGSVSKEVMDQITYKKQDAGLRIEWCSLKSPIEGQVLSRYHEPGEWVSPGTKILTIANIQDIWTYIYVPQTLVAQLSPGLEVTGHLPELGDKVFRGKIIKINSEAEFTPKNVQTREERERLVFGVKVSFAESNMKEELKPGMTIEVDLPN
jgi:HlyD family secretion protein